MYHVSRDGNAMVDARSKGRQGEYEAITYLQLIVNSAFLDMGRLDPPELMRNLDQTRDGGADVAGMEWCVVEVKRQEKLQLPRWWRQVLKAAEKSGGTPILMWRQNRKPWCFKVRTGLVAGGWQTGEHVLDLDQDAFKDWFRLQVRWHYMNENFSKED